MIPLLFPRPCRSLVCQRGRCAHVCVCIRRRPTGVCNARHVQTKMTTSNVANRRDRQTCCIVFAAINVAVATATLQCTTHNDVHYLTINPASACAAEAKVFNAMAKVCYQRETIVCGPTLQGVAILVGGSSCAKTAAGLSGIIGEYTRGTVFQQSQASNHTIPYHTIACCAYKLTQGGVLSRSTSMCCSVLNVACCPSSTRRPSLPSSGDTFACMNSVPSWVCTVLRCNWQLTATIASRCRAAACARR